MSELDPATLGWFNEALDHALQGLDPEHLLPPERVEKLRTLPRKLERHAAGERVTAGAPMRRLKWIVSGWAGEMHVLPDTRRQICSLLLPGDIFAAPPVGQNLRRGVVALTRLDCLDVPSLIDGLDETGDMNALIENRLRDQTERRYDHLTRLGQLSAPQRLAHLLLELHERLRVAGLASDNHFRLPLTREHLADALGLSVVHLDRSLRMLRVRRLLDIRFGGVTLLDQRELLVLAGREPHAV